VSVRWTGQPEVVPDPVLSAWTPLRDLLRRHLSHEVICFLAVGGLGYVVDVLTFNLLLSVPPFAGWDPTVARVGAVAVAMVVTYVGNRMLTWRGASRHDRRQELALFVVFNVIGLMFSVLTLWLSHDVLGLTTRLEDNISANVVGLALGTLFRFWSYRRFVFGPPPAEPADDVPADVRLTAASLVP
jgi:putative flippase GtrA